MKQEKKRIRSVWKYHFENVMICKETDVVFTRCRICKELKPSNLENFCKDTHTYAKRLIQPICRKCNAELQKNYKEERANQITAEQLQEACDRLKHVEQKELFDWEVFIKEEAESNETLESKINKIFNFLWLK